MPVTANKTRTNSRTKNVLSNWAGFVVAAVINFMLSPFIVHSLGDTSYGIWTLLAALVGYMGLLDLGVRGAVTRYIAKFHAEGDNRESTRLASSALAFFLVAGLIAIGLATILAFFVDRIFDIPPDLLAPTRIVVVIGGLSILVSFVSGVYGGIVVGLQRFDFVNIAEITNNIVRALVVIVALKLGMQLIALAIIQLSMSIVRGAANFWMSRLVYPELKVRLAECRRSHLSLLFSFSFSIVLLQASGMLIYFSDSVVIGAFLPLSMVTFFAIAANLIEYAKAPIAGISQTLTPWASALQAKNQIDEVRAGLLGASRIATLVILPIVITFMSRGGAFIELWMGPEYADLSGKVLWILGLSLIPTAASNTIVSTMMGISKHRRLVPIFIVEALSNIALSILLVQQYGVIGVAWGTAIPRLIVSLFIIPLYVRQVLSVPIFQFFVTVWIKPAIAMSLFTLASFYMELTWPAHNLFQFFAQVATIMPLGALGAWIMCLSPDEKSRIAISATRVIRGVQQRFLSTIT